MKTTEIIKELEKIVDEYIDCTESRVIEFAPFIVQVGSLTVGTDKNGVVIAQNVRYPMQFTKEAVNIILEMSWKDGNNAVIMPKVFGRNDWYLNEIKDLQISIDFLKTNEAKEKQK